MTHETRSILAKHTQAKTTVNQESKTCSPSYALFIHTTDI